MTPAVREEMEKLIRTIEASDLPDWLKEIRIQQVEVFFYSPAPPRIG